MTSDWSKWRDAVERWEVLIEAPQLFDGVHGLMLPDGTTRGHIYCTNNGNWVERWVVHDPAAIRASDVVITQEDPTPPPNPPPNGWLGNPPPNELINGVALPRYNATDTFSYVTPVSSVPNPNPVPVGDGPNILFNVIVTTLGQVPHTQVQGQMLRIWNNQGTEQWKDLWVLYPAYLQPQKDVRTLTLQNAGTMDVPSFLHHHRTTTPNKDGTFALVELTWQLLN